MLDTLPREPSYGSTSNTSFAVSTIAFGDGYTQRVPLGLNSTKRTWNLTWSNLDTAEIKIIRDFLTATGGTKAFLWTAIGDTTPSKWVVINAIRENPRDGGQVSTLTATIEQVFDL